MKCMYNREVGCNGCIMNPNEMLISLSHVSLSPFILIIRLTHNTLANMLFRSEWSVDISESACWTTLARNGFQDLSGAKPPCQDIFNYLPYLI